MLDTQRPKYHRPDRECDFFLLLQDGDINGRLVQFWTSKINNENDVELLYSYNNNCHGSDRASLVIYKDNKVWFKHNLDAKYTPWGEDENLIVDAIKDLFVR